MSMQYEKSVLPAIEAAYDELTPTERIIADFFLKNIEVCDFSAKGISARLYVSEAALSRFAKKCQFQGYREFIFRYEESLVHHNEKLDTCVKSVLNTYQELLNKSYALLDEEQLRRIALTLAHSKRIFVYDRGSSIIAAREMMLRFMRIGLDIDVLSDEQVMYNNAIRLDGDMTVIGISISKQNKEVLESLVLARKRGAKTILLTTCQDKAYLPLYDEVVYVSSVKEMEKGQAVSAQFPVIMMMDIFYAYFVQEKFMPGKES